MKYSQVLPLSGNAGEYSHSRALPVPIVFVGGGFLKARYDMKGPLQKV